MKNILKHPNLLWMVGLTALFVISFSYIFDSKLNLNGDNCYYFANATSLAKGDGYADMFGKPTTNFPPGYPLLMAPLRMVTDSIVAQKILNGLFLLGGVLREFVPDGFLKLIGYGGADGQDLRKTQLTDHLSQLITEVFTSGFLRKHS